MIVFNCAFCGISWLMFPAIKLEAEKISEITNLFICKECAKKHNRFTEFL